ncbi:MAG: formylmethanofuran dehydrogenase subunit C [Methylohalobius sp.]|nr:formylmethanofuran dehydrogenase subunit C [Methylohalobius sp.]
MRLSLHTAPEVPLETDCLCPDQLLGKSAKEIAKLLVFHGNQRAELGEFFHIQEGAQNGTVTVEGDLAKVKQVGAGMSDGKLRIVGNVGAHLGAEMRGGEIVVEGSAGDWVGREMRGGRITILGDAGHLVGSAVRGAAVGMTGGEIFILGSAKNEVGNGMRRGLIAIAGDSGDFTGVNLKAGTVVVLGNLGLRSGAGMVRGTILSTQPAELLPTFCYDTTYRPPIVRTLLLYLRRQGFTIEDVYINGPYRRFSGDAIELNKGEILLYAG